MAASQSATKDGNLTLGSVLDRTGYAVQAQELIRHFSCSYHWSPKLRTTEYFVAVRSRPDRAGITDEWILRVKAAPESEFV